MDHLLDGYRRFRRDVWPAQRARFEQMAEGQSPQTMIIACSDSRIDPQTVFGAGPGELFVVRNVAALVPPYSPDGGYHGTSAALEFAVRVLKVARIVVLGHAQCGGVAALVNGAPEEAMDFVAPWMEIAKTATMQDHRPSISGESRLSNCEAAVVRVSLANLLTFPWIDEAVQEGRLALHGFRFDIRTGVLTNVEGLHPQVLV